jgi:hypothetical protein
MLRAGGRIDLGILAGQAQVHADQTARPALTPAGADTPNLEYEFGNLLRADLGVHYDLDDFRLACHDLTSTLVASLFSPTDTPTERPRRHEIHPGGPVFRSFGVSVIRVSMDGLGARRCTDKNIERLHLK